LTVVVMAVPAELRPIYFSRPLHAIAIHTCAHRKEEEVHWTGFEEKETCVNITLLAFVHYFANNARSTVSRLVVPLSTVAGVSKQSQPSLKPSSI